LKVVDGDGNPLPGESGVIYCVAPGDCQSASANPDGSIQPFFVDPNVQYQVFGFARNTGWGCGFEFDGMRWWFSASTTVLGKSLARPTTFVVQHKSCLELHVLRADDGQPFPSGVALVRACPTVGCVSDGPGANVVYGSSAADGTVGLEGLDPAVEYDFLAMAVDVPGWTCPDYSDGTKSYWFPAGGQVTGVPGALEGTTFSIADRSGCTTTPDTVTATVLNGETGTPFSAGAGLMACVNGACVFGSADANGVVHMTNLDPSVQYQFTAWVSNPAGWDWSCGWSGDGGVTNFFFSPTISGHPSDVDGMQFTITSRPTDSCP
jgi:hypothetical protein